MPNFPAAPEFSRPLSTSPRDKSRDTTCCSRTERCCCMVATWLPISIVYGATAWAVYVNGYLISIRFISGVSGWLLATVTGVLYGLCILSYSLAVFTDPLSPIDADNGYSYLPQWTPSAADPTLPPTLTLKSDGRARYCQKCNYTKPDRTHHCSICRRCILKMDHHCPWLGNCIGFANYKAFVLFLGYLSVFCLLCTGCCAASLWYWVKFVSPNADYLPVQWILLAVIAGVVALCVGGFSIWHIIHVLQNITTIEALEKTRYIHTFPSPQNGNNHPHGRRRRRSSNDSPNAFDIGRRKNWEQVMGENPWLWFLPVMNSLGNGLSFPVSDDVRGILRGMRAVGQPGGYHLGGVVEEGSEEEDEDERVYRRDEEGRWMMHD